MRRLENKICLVTGAGSGIGRACALALGSEGARVIVADIDAEGGAQTCEDAAEAGTHACFKTLDVADEGAWTEMIAAIEREFGALHVLVNNAALCIAAPLLTMSFATWRRQMSVNLDGVFLGTKAALPLIAASGGGSIANISSVAGLKGIAALSGYCATKAGVRMFTKAVALECAQAKNNVRVNSIHPGAIETPIWMKMANEGNLPDPADRANVDFMAQARAASEAATPLGFAGVPADIAAGVVFLASDDARFITGTELVIDGGVMAG